MAKRLIAAFDFDETLIKQDTLPDFLRQSFPPSRFFVNVLLSIPMLIGFKLGMIDSGTAKEKLLTRFLEDMPLYEFDLLCQKYSKRLESLANPEAIQRLKWHRERGDEIVIVSASPENWIIPWAKKLGVDKIIATKLARHNGTLTGKLATPNCHGQEKVRRFLTEYPDRKSYVLYMYGDGKSDGAMFDLSDEPYVKQFS